MRRWTIALTVALLTAGLAGCMGSEEDAGSTAAPSSTNGTQTDANETQPTGEAGERDRNVTVTWYNGTVQGANLPVVGPVCYLDCASTDFEVPNGTTTLYAEVAWNASTTMSLDLDAPCQAEAGEDCPPESQSGQSPLTVTVTDENLLSNQEWSAGVFADESPAQSTEFTLAISLFQGDPMPSDYGKLGD